MINYTLTTSVMGVACVLSIFWLIRKHTFYVRYTFWWLFVSIGVLVFSLMPTLADMIVKFLGISYAPTLLFFCAILMLFIKNLFMDIDRSKQEIRLRRLTQRLALLEEEIKRTKQDKEEK